MTRRSVFPAANRPVAMGVNSMVVSTHPLASQAGVRMLMDGGNAFDASVATAAALNDVQQAIGATRLRLYTGLPSEMESRFPDHVLRALVDLGHDVAVIEPLFMPVEGTQGIQVDSDAGVFQGGADPRRDGFAIAW